MSNSISIRIHFFHLHYLFAIVFVGFKFNFFSIVWCRMAEYAHISSVAEEERKKRPDYRPVLELDGFLGQRSQNQVSLYVNSKIPIIHLINNDGWG